MGIQRLDLAEFYRSSRDDCLRTVVVIVGDQDSAQELVAEAFARACTSWRTVSGHPAPAAWVVRTAVNLNISRWRRHRREVPVADPGMAAGSVMLGLGLSGAPGAAPNGATGTIRGTSTIHTAAFTLTRNANGTATLTLSKSQMLDPAALQQALAQDGIRALVKTEIMKGQC